ncbi:MAG: hypothetical protein PHD37_12690 [Gallionellaceae bacterium]|nr:hypothetical protein [Gallionellaceae bacterium]
MKTRQNAATPDESLILAIESEVLAYLEARPASADTLEGIHRWWIRWPGLEEPMSITEIALNRLQARGLLEQCRVGSRILWRKPGAGR